MKLRFLANLAKYAALLPLCAAPAAAGAQTSGSGQEWLQPITGVGLLEPTLNGIQPTYYGSSDAAPNWRIAQWSMPGNKLSPLAATVAADGGTVLSASSTEASVSITLGAAPAVQLHQDGSILPCDNANGKPRESDLFFSPGGFHEPKPGVSGLTPAALQSPALAQLKSLVFSTSLSVKEGKAAHPKGCMVNQGGALIGVTLVNHAGPKPQTLFYQLQFSRICDQTDPRTAQMCHHISAHPAYWSKVNPFGGGDVLPALSVPMLASNQQRNLQLDLLPRLKQLIAEGPAAMDKDLSHWSVGNIYLGQHIWGDVSLESSWKNISLKAY